MGKINWNSFNWFGRYEFDDPSFEESGNFIDVRLVTELEELREETGWRIITHYSVGGCVDVMGMHGHAPNSFHLKRCGACACDFHFETDANPREQFFRVKSKNFSGIGVYYDWKWKGKKLPLGFHVDLRPSSVTQLWVRSDNKYMYYLK